MADLSTLDDTQPINTDLVSEGDDRIRETRVAVKTSFNVEHALAGYHAFLVGNAGARPAAGNSGRIYLNTENTWIEYDTGSVFNQLNAVGITYAAGAGGTLNLTPSDGVSATVTTRANSRLIVFGQGRYTATTSGTAQGQLAFNYSLQVDGATTGISAPTTQVDYLNIYASVFGSATVVAVRAFWSASGYAAGSHTVTLRHDYDNNLSAGTVSGVGFNANQPSILVLTL